MLMWKIPRNKFVRFIYFRCTAYSSLALSSETSVTLEPFRGLQATNSTSKIRVALFKAYKYLISSRGTDPHLYDRAKTITKSMLRF